MRQSKRREPILIIDVLELGYQSSTIKLFRPGYSSEVIETSWGHGNLAEYFERYHQGLRKFKLELQSDNLEQDFRELTRAFKRLYVVGKPLLDKLLGGRTEIIKYLTSYAFDIPRYKPSRPLGANLIEIRARNIKEIVPIECLVIPGSKPEVESLSDVARAASGILGFSFVINRVVKRTGQSHKEELRNVPRLPLKLFSNSSLPGVDLELDFFSKKECFELDGPWPEEYTETFEKDLVRYLFHPAVRFGQSHEVNLDECFSDEIHHISCHCYTEAKHSWDFRLELLESQSITLGSMDRHLTDLKHTTLKATRGGMPLVFFNACGSSKLTPQGMISFPEYFLDLNGNCGFIGTEINVPDSFAGEFCKQFYLHLVRGFGVGEAIFRARHKMLARFNNPLGILYMSYADPFLKVTKPVDNL